MKASTSTGGIKNLILQHIEKIVLGVAVILVALFLWSALGVKPIDAAKSPKTLETAAKEQSERIAMTKEPPPPPPTPNFVGGVAAGLEPVRVDVYSHPQRLSPPIQPPIVKRPDPKLLPVERLIATPVVISIPEEGLPPTWKEEDEEKTKKAAKKKKEPLPNIDGGRGRRRGRGAPGYGAPGYGQAGQPGYGDTAQGGYGKTAAGGRRGHGGGTGYGTTPQSQPGYGQTGRGGSSDRSTADYSSRYGAAGGSRGGAPGYGSTGYGGSGYGGSGVPGGKPGVVVQQVETKGVIRPAVVLTGRVPYSKQFDEFVNKFKEAIQPEGHSPERDFPVYNQFKIERQEVTGSGDEKWVVLDLDQAFNDRQKWMVQPDADQVDPAYLDQYLAWPMPPTIGRNWGRVASHPAIPFTWMFEETQQRGLTGRGYGADPSGVGSRSRNTSMDGGGGYGYGATGAAYSNRYGNTGYGATGHGRSGYGTTTASDGGPGRSRSGFAAAPEMPGFTEAPLTAHVPSYLFRFVDTQKVEAGKQYRYRVTLELANPNFGLDPAILADGGSSNKENVLTPPAETATVTVPRERTLYALAAKTNKSLVDHEGQVLFHVWNPKMGAEIAKEFDLKLGEIAEFVDTVENWYNPYTGLAEKLESVPFQFVEGKPTAAPMLADITGGERLPGAKSTDEPQPAEMLFIDANGRMFTANEARDAAALDYYKERYVEEPAAETDSELFAPQQPAARGAPAGAYGGQR